MTQQEVEQLIDELESFAQAYPESVFGPVTDAEIRDFPNLITRNSAAMGRHMGKWMQRAADALRALAAAPPTEGAIPREATPHGVTLVCAVRDIECRNPVCRQVGCIMETNTHPAAPKATEGAAMKALQELVRLKLLKERYTFLCNMTPADDQEGIRKWQEMRAEYERCKTFAWSAAYSVIASPIAPPTEQKP